MPLKKINSKNFDLKLRKLLNLKHGKDVVRSRADLEDKQFSERAHFIVNLMSSLKRVSGVTYKILFWEENVALEKFFRNRLKIRNFNIHTAYKNGKLPGVIFFDATTLDKLFLKLLLDHHFNYEMAVEPSLNLRVQICINQEFFIIIFDIYDDRGCDIYYIDRAKND